MILVMNGKIQSHNLMQCGKDEKWLRDTFNGIGITVEETYFASVNTQGIMTAQRKAGGPVSISAIPPEKVVW